MSFIRNLAIGLASVGAATLTVLACSSGTNNTTGGGGADTSSFITDYCATLAPCCGALNKPTDGASCRAIYSAFSGATVYDATKGSACLSELHTAQGSADFCSTFTEKSPSCKGVYNLSGGATGTKAPGATCTEDGDCMASTEGDVTCASTFVGSAETKTCQIEARGKENDGPCNQTRDGSNTSYTGFGTAATDGGAPMPATKAFYCDVTDGLFCSTHGQALSKCTKIQPVGGACDSFDQGCTKDAFCDFSVQKCAPRVAAGATCNASSGSSSCVSGSYCAKDTMKCTTQLADGTACTGSEQCVSKSCVNTKCAASSNSALSLVCGS